MATPWFQREEVQAILKALTPRDLSIVQSSPTVGEPVLCWSLPDKVEQRFDVLIDQAVNREVGYKFGEKYGDVERWIEVYEQQATVQSVLVPHFGDPNVLGRDLATAREIHRRDPGFAKREWDSLKSLREQRVIDALPPTEEGDMSDGG